MLPASVASACRSASSFLTGQGVEGVAARNSGARAGLGVQGLRLWLRLRLPASASRNRKVRACPSHRLNTMPEQNLTKRGLRACGALLAAAARCHESTGQVICSSPADEAFGGGGVVNPQPPCLVSDSWRSRCSSAWHCASSSLLGAEYKSCNRCRSVCTLLLLVRRLASPHHRALHALPSSMIEIVKKNTNPIVTLTVTVLDYDNDTHVCSDVVQISVILL